MGKRFFLRSESFEINGNELRIQFFCRCGKFDVMRFSAKELAGGGTYTCTTCGKSLKLNGLAWDGRVVTI